MIDRRTFVVGAAGAICSGRLFSQAKPMPVPFIVDTHIHCFAGLRDARFPYHPDGPYQPDAAATPEHLLKAMQAAGVDRAIVVHPEPYQDDHRYLEHCLKVGNGKLKGTCLFFADRPDAIAKLRVLAKATPLVAARVHAYQPERQPPFGKPELAAYWKAAGDLGLAIQIHFEPRYASGFEPLIREHPSIRVLVDHLGRPFQGTEKEYQQVLDWSKYKNVIVKLSAVPTEASYPHRSPAKIVKQLIDAYGPERLISGGGYDAKATGETYRAERERVKSLLTGLSADQSAAILGGNAARLFGFV
jgi:predicted TIM-barrel fold metal-dependent hydrolase